MSQNSEAQLESFMKAGDLGRALQLATAMTSVNPSDTKANMALGRIRLMQGLQADARTAAQRVLDSTPEDEPAMLLMVGILAAMGKTDEGLEWCDRIMRSIPIPCRSGRPSSSSEMAARRGPQRRVTIISVDRRQVSCADADRTEST